MSRHTSPHLRVLVVQSVLGGVLEHERKVIAEKAGLLEEHFVSLDLRRSSLSLERIPEILSSYNAVVLAGSPFSLPSGQEAEIHLFTDTLIKETLSRQLPIFGICWGHQVLAHALGGKVVKDPMRAERGFARIYKSPQANDDPVFSHLPESFLSRVHHEDHVEDLPATVEHLLYNSVSEIQGFRLQGKPVYGVQFHPEVSHEDVRYRYQHFRDVYFTTDEEAEQRAELLVHVDNEVHAILSAFFRFISL